MDLLRQTLRDARTAVQSAAVGARDQRAFERASDDELATQLGAVAELARLVEGMLIDAVGEAARRADNPVRADRMTDRLGCHDLGELLQRTTRLSPQTARRLERAAAAVRPSVSDTTGEVLDASFPSVRAAMIDGVLGVDGVLSIVDPLQSTAPRVAPAARRAAADVVVAEARGDGPDGAPPACAEILRIHAQAWACALDQDGAEPRERTAERKRHVTLGVATPDGVPLRALLLPEVAAQLQTIFDAQLSPRVSFPTPPREAGGTEAGGPSGAGRGDDGPVAPLDERTRRQKQHDAFAAALGAAASSGRLPTIGGAPATLVVQVDAEDLASGRGFAHVQGCAQPVSLAVARHIGCGEVVERVSMAASGRIVAMGTGDRVFGHRQRRAIALCDGGCIIPGCGVSAAWCEIHHVVEHSRGGPTHTDNGVLLCWHHHRSLDRGGWGIRMRHGVPEVRAPGWFDASLRWRAVSTAPIRRRTRILRG